jgi:hypothetical protein
MPGADSLICQNILRCRILELLGGGGTEMVYKTGDIGLHRSVTPNFLPGG